MGFEDLRLQFPRGTTAENNAYTGGEGEFTIDEERKEVRLHDGVTPGGMVIGGREFFEKILSFEYNAQRNTIFSVNGKTGNVVLDKIDIGLSNVDNVKQAPITRQINAGNGLQGSGTLENDLTFSMKTPQDISGSTQNESGLVGHTHAVIASAAKNITDSTTLLLTEGMVNHLSGNDHTARYVELTGDTVTGNVEVNGKVDVADGLVTLSVNPVTKESYLLFGLKQDFFVIPADPENPESVETVYINETSLIEGLPAKITYNKLTGQYRFEIANTIKTFGEMVEFDLQLQINNGSVYTPGIFEGGTLYEAGKRVSVTKYYMEDGVLYMRNLLEDCSISVPIEFLPIVPTTSIYYGGFTGVSISNTATRIDANGALVGSETTVGTLRSRLAGADTGVDTNCIYYGGSNDSSSYPGIIYNLVTRIDASGILVGSETNVGSARLQLAGASIENYGVYYGGFTTIARDIATRIDTNGTLVGSETSVGTARERLAGAGLDTIGLYYGGYHESVGAVNFLTRLNSNSVLVGSETTLGKTREWLGGARIDNYVVFYAGADNFLSQGPGAYYNTITRIDINGTLVGSETNAGTARHSLAGAGLDTVGVYYGGSTNTVFANGIYLNKVTRLNSSGTQVGAETNTGTAREALAGASI